MSFQMSEGISMANKSPDRNILQLRVDDECNDIIKMLKSTNLKSFFVGEAIKSFAETKEGKIFLKEIGKNKVGNSIQIDIPCEEVTTGKAEEKDNDASTRQIEEW